MNLDRIREYDEEVYREFCDYVDRHGLGLPIQDLMARTLLRSIAGGDGMVWSNSLLLTAIQDPQSGLRTLFDRLPGYRASLLAATEFKSTLHTQHLVPAPRFQDQLTDLLFDAKRHGSPATNEEDVLLIELRRALDEFYDQSGDIAGFVIYLTEPILERVPAADSRDNEQRFSRFAAMLQDCVCASLMAKEHPFAALERRHGRETRSAGGQEATGDGVKTFRRIFDQYTRGSFERARRVFYWRIRDMACLGLEALPDAELLEISYRFEFDQFGAVCDSLDSEYVGDPEDHYRKEDVDSREDADRLDSWGLYAASMIWNSGVPVAVLVERLANWRTYKQGHDWPTSQKLLVSLSDSKIEIHRQDVSGAPRGGARARRVLADVGLWTPDAIWSDDVLARLEGMINSTSVTEQDIQWFFEAYPEFIMDELHAEAFPQAVLYQETGPNLRPDFIMRREGSRAVDIVELKKPQASTVVRASTRPRISAEVMDGIAQLRDYRGWFSDSANRKLFSKRYGLEGFRPRLTLVIGRRVPGLMLDAHVDDSGAGDVRILNYDDIAEAARRRRQWMG